MFSHKNKQRTQCHYHLKVIFSDESGQNLNIGKPTQYDGRSHVKSGHQFIFLKMSTNVEYLLFKISLFDFGALFYCSKWSYYDVNSQSAVRSFTGLASDWLVTP